MSDIFFIKRPNFKVESLSEKIVQIKRKECCDKERYFIKTDYASVLAYAWKKTDDLNSITMESILIKPNPLKSTNQAKELASFIICLICMFIFLFSAYEKIAEHEIFMTGLANVQVLSRFAIPISWIVPFLEIFISIMLIIPQTQTKGLIAFIELMSLFTVYIASMWFWASKLPCHCNLIIDQLTWGEHIWFNLAFIGLAVVALLFHSSHLNTLKLKT